MKQKFSQVYIPNLWYYEKLKFLEEHVVPRKSKTSQLPNATKIEPLLSVQVSILTCKYIKFLRYLLRYLFNRKYLNT